ncbi:hypothetical protein [Acinetobacter sp.]|uniref:hypothetical protein n=1 Tax=Acinetobacter sp. TaxID=472 RepID=UPI0028A09C8F|nr:hypothetical protein [Acinetobacter sp.]
MATQFSNTNVSKQKVLEHTENSQKTSTSLTMHSNLSDFKIINPSEPDGNHPVMYPKNQGTDLNRLFSYQKLLKPVKKHPSIIHHQVQSQQYSVHTHVVVKTVTKTLVILLETAVSP